MNDPTANFKTLEPAALPDASDWAAGLQAVEDWTSDLTTPFDDVPSFDKEADPEVNAAAGLPADRTLIRTAGRRLFVDYRPDPDALLTLAKLPRAGQTLHGVICGKYALWQLIPALVERTGQRVAELHLATLSFSKQNAAELLGMLDAGHVKRVSLLVSYYFKKTSRPIYDSLVPQLLERGQRVLAMRIHAKICLLRMGRGGTRYVIESSANLRSCKNVEQFTLTRCPKLYRFHRDWLDGELMKPREKEAADVD